MLFAKRLALAAAVLGLTAGTALARPAVSETSLNVRSGPGTQYPVVGVLQAGETVDAGPCTRSWCRVASSGGSGWASARYLQFGGAVGYAAPPPAVVYDDYPYYDDFYYYGPSFGVGFVAPAFRHRHYHWRRGDRRHWVGRRGDWRGRVVSPPVDRSRFAVPSRPAPSRGMISRPAFSGGGTARLGGAPAIRGNVGGMGSARGGGAAMRGGGGGGGGMRSGEGR
ncbi:MAG TPA: SH3 domain-containing protein [Xanthobacteraceae bacterium]|nr:SH3 domain-containing protein [Xanthobacteraceae bacterium]